MSLAPVGFIGPPSAWLGTKISVFRIEFIPWKWLSYFFYSVRIRQSTWDFYVRLRPQQQQQQQQAQLPPTPEMEAGLGVAFAAASNDLIDFK